MPCSMHHTHTLSDTCVCLLPARMQPGMKQEEEATEMCRGERGVTYKAERKSYMEQGNAHSGLQRTA
jgi:hypothetical protein